jgi:signal-transduction protein with cAMP-binding, CBS, and nucleotidyltransferase domain
MHQRAVGTLVVVNDTAQPIGILTDRDLVSRVLAKDRLATEMSVSEVMTPAPRTVSEQTPIESALSLMRSGRFRRIPVVGKDKQLVGLVSLDDILMLLAEEFGQIGRLLERETPRGVIEGLNSAGDGVTRLQNESRLSQGA